MNLDSQYLQLYAVTDRTWSNDKGLIKQVEDALKGGITCLQLREKNLQEEEFLEEALKIKKLCQKYKVPFIINDNVEIAIKTCSDGIHVGQSDMKAMDVRKKIGDKMLLGVSVQTVAQAIEAEKNGANYLGVGAVFSTSTKLDADIVSYDTLKAISNAVNIPIVAIGGISKHNIMDLSNKNIQGVALVSAIFASKNIENECKELLKLSRKMISK